MSDKYIKNLKNLREKINFSAAIENQEIKHVLKWLKKRNSKNKMISKQININDLKDWKTDKKGNISHKSSQFFGVQGVKIYGANREVTKWDQPILTQKHGGILAILFRENKNKTLEFLLYARKEPGDNNLKLCPSFSATQSNMNLAHGGKKTHLTDFILNKKKAKLICKTLHYEEGARFWQKPNKNLLLQINEKYNQSIKNPNFIWVNYSQIKKLNLVNGVINPFVKTIMFMI